MRGLDLRSCLGLDPVDRKYYASGDVLYSGDIHNANPPATLFATLDTRAGGSTPVEGTPLADFDDTTVEYLDFLVRLPANYAGGGLTFGLEVAMTSATTAEVVMSAAIRRIVRDAEDLDAAHTYDYNNSAATTVASLAGETVNVAITFTSGADMDSWAAGEWGIVRIRRFASDAGDDATGDCEMVGFSISET